MEKRKMKTFLALGFAVLLVSTGASAQGLDPNYPFCVRGKVGTAGSFDCTYRTIGQCRASASPDGYCQRNPVYHRSSARYERWAR